MDFGMPTLIEITDLEETMKLASNLHLSFVELNMNLPQYQMSKLEDNIAVLTELKEKYEVYYTIHLDENLNVCDFNDDVREAYLLTVIRTTEIAKQLEIPIINMHMNHGVHFTLPDRKIYLFEQYKDDYLKSIMKFRNLCETAIGNSDIKICIENTNGYRPYEKEAISLLLESKAFGLTWDIGHSNSVQNIDESFIILNKDNLIHFHIHDSVNKSDHMILGTGEIDLKQRLKIAKEHNCRCVVETKTIDALRKSVIWLNETGYIPANKQDIVDMFP